MTCGEFRKRYNVREVERCCATCRHGRDLCDDGAYECHHADMEGDYILNFAEDVCDVWEGKERETEKGQNH